jgi:hypothetical protein
LIPGMKIPVCIESTIFGENMLLERTDTHSLKR